MFDTLLSCVGSVSISRQLYKLVMIAQKGTLLGVCKRLCHRQLFACMSLPVCQAFVERILISCYVPRLTYGACFAVCSATESAIVSQSHKDSMFAVFPFEQHQVSPGQCSSKQAVPNVGATGQYMMAVHTSYYVSGFDKHVTL